MHLILLSSLVSAVLAAPWNHAQGRDGSSGKTAYFLDNDPSGSSIVSLKIGADGKLSNPVRTLTGGNGAIATNKTGFTDDVDTLDSQGSVVVSGDVCPSFLEPGEVWLGKLPRSVVAVRRTACRKANATQAPLHRQCRQRHTRHVQDRSVRPSASLACGQPSRHTRPVPAVCHIL